MGGERKLSPPIAFSLAVIVAAALAGCGASGTPKHRVKTAIAKILASSWTRYEIEFERPHLFPAAVTLQGGRAAYDLKARLGYSFLQLRLPTGGSELLFTDLAPTTFFVSPSPTPAGALPAGKGWISVPLLGPASDRTLATQAEGMAPTLLLDEVAWAARNTSSLGTQVVGSVPTAAYRVSVDLSAALRAAKIKRDVGIAAAIEQELHANPSKSLAVRIWVNGPGYVSKIEGDVPGSELGTTSFLFFSFNRPYTGTLPPASQVAPLASLKRGGKSLWAIATGS